MTDSPKVSVLLLCYQQEATIGEAFLSILRQEAPFSLEILVADDASRDGTVAKIRELAGAVGGGRTVRFFERSHLGMIGNFRDALLRCRGEYVAILEGDDYWIGTEKLRRQVELLEARPELVLCGHRALALRPPPEPETIFPVVAAGDLSFPRLFERNLLPTASLMARRAAIPELPSWVDPLLAVDWVFSMLVAGRGGVHLLDGVFSAHRQYPPGVWGSLSPERQWAYTIQTQAAMLCSMTPAFAAPLVGGFLGRLGERNPATLCRELRAGLARVVGEVERAVPLDRALRSKLRRYRLRASYRVFRAAAAARYLLWKSLPRRSPPEIGECAACGRGVHRFLPLREADPDLLPQLEIGGFDMELIDRFETLALETYLCPHCQATDRDRLMALYLKAAPRDGRVLHVAPSRALRGTLARLRPEVLEIDLHRPDVAGHSDLQAMPELADGSFSFFLCSHVLEHVADDRAALRELHRVLTPDGSGLLLVPLCLSLAETREGTQAVPALERLRRFGQIDHLRLYAKRDFVARCVEAGFAVDELGIGSFGAEAFRRNGIDERAVLYRVRKGAAAARWTSDGALAKTDRK